MSTATGLDPVVAGQRGMVACRRDLERVGPGVPESSGPRPRADSRRSARHFVNVDMSDVINSVTLFPLSSYRWPSDCISTNCVNETNGGNLIWQADQFAIRRQTIC